MKPEVITIISVALVTAYFFYRRSKVPKKKEFRCARCSSIVQQTPHTIDAWRAGKSKSFCDACYAEWVRSHPASVK